MRIVFLLLIVHMFADSADIHLFHLQALELSLWRTILLIQGQRSIATGQIDTCEAPTRKKKYGFRACCFLFCFFLYTYTKLLLQYFDYIIIYSLISYWSKCTVHSERMGGGWVSVNECCKFIKHTRYMYIWIQQWKSGREVAYQ